MAFVIKDPVIEVNGDDLSEHVASVTVDMAADDVDVSTSGPGVHKHLGGLRNDSFAVTFLTDSTGVIDDALFPLLATPTAQPEFTVSVKKFEGATSDENPEWLSHKAILLNYSPIGGNIGDRSETQVTFPSNEMIEKKTT